MTGILLFSCNQKSKTNPETSKERIDKESKIENVENLDWLLGKWKRLNEEKGKETFENWNKISSTEYSGIGFTMLDGDTIKQEKIRVIKQNGKWDLIVKTPEDKYSIVFPIKELNSNEFISTNDSLDFPKQIKYWKNGDRINALVSGDSLKIEFEFEKIE